MKLKTYWIYKSAGDRVGMVYATCITGAAQKFIATLDKPAIYELNSTAEASIRYLDNHCVMSDFVVSEA